MYLLTKYLYIVIYMLGLVFIGLYINLCEINDLFLSYISKKVYKLNKSYDYIVVGSGSAGSVIALRLSEDPNISVLLLEAGNYGGKLIDIPALAPILHKSSHDWQYKTEPQENACKAFENNASYWPMGKIFGGTGRLNNMMYTRGHRSDFEEWYKNVPDYNFEKDVLEFFKKAENQVGSFVNEKPEILKRVDSPTPSCSMTSICEPPTPQSAITTKKTPKYHAFNGPLIASDLPVVSEFSRAVMKAAKLLGFPIRDINGEFNSGFSQPQVNLKDGSRFATAHYLLQNKKSNLVIKTASFVEKILFKYDFEANGVQFSNLGEKFVIKARRGIVLSAGVIGTPKILMLSGIGLKGHLDDIGIETKINLPVGNNLQDHVSTGFDLVTLNQPLSMNFYTMGSPLSLYEYFFKSTGPLTTIGCEALAILTSSCLDFARNNSYDSCEHSLKQSPDLELIFIPLAMSADFGLHLRNIVDLRNSVWNDYFAKIVDKNALNILPIALHPKSRGTVRLKDKNPRSMPIIDPKYLTHPYDVEILLTGIDLIKRIIKTKSLQDLGAQINDNKFPGCEHFVFDTRDYWKCYVRHLTITLYHPVGTCKVGHEDDKDSVVNYDFKVIGTNKLFVADGSVIPSLTSANTNAAIVMIAEKVASLVKYYKYLEENTCNIKEVFLRKTFC